MLVKSFFFPDMTWRQPQRYFTWRSEMSDELSVLSGSEEQKRRWSNGRSPECGRGVPGHKNSTTPREEPHWSPPELHSDTKTHVSNLTEWVHNEFPSLLPSSGASGSSCPVSKASHTVWGSWDAVLRTLGGGSWTASERIGGEVSLNTVKQYIQSPNWKMSQQNLKLVFYIHFLCFFNDSNFRFLFFFRFDYVHEGGYVFTHVGLSD